MHTKEVQWKIPMIKNFSWFKEKFWYFYERLWEKKQKELEKVLNEKSKYEDLLKQIIIKRYWIDRKREHLFTINFLFWFFSWISSLFYDIIKNKYENFILTSIIWNLIEKVNDSFISYILDNSEFWLFSEAFEIYKNEINKLENFNDFSILNLKLWDIDAITLN